MKSKWEKFLSNKKLFWSVVGTLIFLVVGTTLFFLGAYLTGWYVWEWFISGTALVIYYIALCIVLPIIGGLFLMKYLYGDKFNGRK